MHKPNQTNGRRQPLIWSGRGGGEYCKGGEGGPVGSIGPEVIPRWREGFLFLRSRQHIPSRQMVPYNGSVLLRHGPATTLPINVAQKYVCLTCQKWGNSFI